MALLCHTSKVLSGLKSVMSFTIQFTRFALSPKRAFALSSALAEISSTVILSKPSSSKLSTSLLLPLPMSIIFAVFDKPNACIKFSEVIGTSCVQLTYAAVFVSQTVSQCCLMLLSIIRASYLKFKNFCVTKVSPWLCTFVFTVPVKLSMVFLNAPV